MDHASPAKYTTWSPSTQANTSLVGWPEAQNPSPEFENGPGAGQNAKQASRSPASGSSTQAGPANLSKGFLSCEMCRHRKIRCDKGQPCTNCQKSGIRCVAQNRQRLPRGRNGGRKKADVELKARVGRLESLVKTLEANNNSASVDPALKHASAPGKHGAKIAEDGANTTPSNNRRGTTSQHDPEDSDMSRYMGSLFWSNLTTEINGIRDVLDQPDDDDLDSVEPNTPSTDSPRSEAQQSGFSFILFGPHSMIVNPDAIVHPSPETRSNLCQLYLERIHPIFKLLHGPTLKAFMQDGTQYLRYPPDHPAPEALKFCTYYATVSVVDETICQETFGATKSALMSKFRFGAEITLSKADFINTTDLTVLQAFMLFLLCSRLHDSSRFVWTMLSVAVRIAQDAMELNQEKQSLPPFDQEMRRRAWNQLCVMDVQAAIDRVSPTLISLGDSFAMMPSEINDSDISPDDSGPIKAKLNEITDMSFSLMTRWSSVVARQIHILARGAAGRAPLDIEQNWEKRKDCALRIRRFFDVHYLPHLDPNNTYHTTLKSSTNIVTAFSLLNAVRPAQRHPKTQPPNISGHAILNLVCDMLEAVHSAWTNPVTSVFNWFGFLYSKWHAIAVALAELCVLTEGPAVERAWAIIEPTYATTSMSVADSTKGKLWRPVEKLMKRARAIRAQKKGLPLDDSKPVSTANEYERQNSRASIPDTSLFGLTSTGQVMSQPPSDTLQSMNLTGSPLFAEPQWMHDPSQAIPLQQFGMSSGDNPQVMVHGIPATNEVNMANMPSPAWDDQQEINPHELEMGPNALAGSSQTAWANWQTFVNDLHFDVNGMMPTLFEGTSQSPGARMAGESGCEGFSNMTPQ